MNLAIAVRGGHGGSDKLSYLLNSIRIVSIVFSLFH